MARAKQIISRFLLLYIILAVIALLALTARMVQQEVHTSKYQARYLSQISQQLSFKLLPGASDAVRYPGYGPYDQRLGYIFLPEMIKLLHAEGFKVDKQAVFSKKMLELKDDFGIFPVYHEKFQAGLALFDRHDQVMFSARYPEHGYASFQTIPPVILNTLLFIENRELLTTTSPTVNPAIEWDRLGFAGLSALLHKLGGEIHVSGGSTLATQIEKYRHSPNGYTHSFGDKLQQMSTASLRAYLQGSNTLAMREEIALSYLNTMPLSATPQFGEVHGLGDGLSAWFGADFSDTNRLLMPASLLSYTLTKQQAIAYRQTLSLLLSQRRPSYLLGRGFTALQKLTDAYLRILADQGVISGALAHAALQERVEVITKASAAAADKTVLNKTPLVMRSRLANLLNIRSNYELDRLDLTVKSTLDNTVQQAVTDALKKLSQAEQVNAAGLIGSHLLTNVQHLDAVTYSLMLYERTPEGNLLRVQTDNYQQSLDINEGIRLDLGSTSKLRTLVHYLELIADIYQQYHDYTPKSLAQLALHPRDHLSLWVVEQLRVQPNINLAALLTLAIDKTYSASPGESFFTGGGLHSFANFNKADNYKVLSVRHALRDSVNLVFIRLMRDVVYHHLYKPEGIARWLESPDDPRREEYLARFAEREGSIYLRKFFAKYHGMTAEQALLSLTQRVYANPARLTMLYRAIYPNHDQAALADYLKAHVDTQLWEGEKISSLFNKYSTGRFDLQDQGYITKLHPLELWLVSYLAEHPGASQKEVLEAGQHARQQVYRWLIKSRKHHAQQQRIMMLLEIEAFWKIHEAWQRVGYPFEALTPSYATSIGASGDRPAALAELVGILLNDGVKLSSVRFESLHFAKDTPYETQLSKQLEAGERIFPAEVAHVAREALIGVVAGGTASRLQGVYKDAQGKPMDVGGKTGTGDHRKEIWGAGGRLLSAKSVSRAAVFTFFLGERFYGVMTAYVEGEQAANYEFTSSLPVQIVKYLQPIISRLWLPSPVPSEPNTPTIAASIAQQPVQRAQPSTPPALIPKQSTQIVYQRLLKKIVAHTSMPAAQSPASKETQAHDARVNGMQKNAVVAPEHLPVKPTASVADSGVQPQPKRVNAVTERVMKKSLPVLAPVTAAKTAELPLSKAVSKKLEPVIKPIPRANIKEKTKENGLNRPITVGVKSLDNKPKVLPNNTVVTLTPARNKVQTTKVEPAVSASASVLGQKKKPPTLAPKVSSPNTLKPTRPSEGESEQLTLPALKVKKPAR